LTFVKRTINQASIVVRFFNASHQPNAKLQELIKANNVQGGGLKKYVSTRWHTCYDHLESIWRLRICLITVSLFYIIYFICYYLISSIYY
jgi:hypothetical protein